MLCYLLLPLPPGAVLALLDIALLVLRLFCIALFMLELDPKGDDVGAADEPVPKGDGDALELDGVLFCLAAMAAAINP